MECPKQKTSDGDQREARQVSEGTTGDWQRTGRRKCSKQPEARKQGGLARKLSSQRLPVIRVNRGKLTSNEPNGDWRDEQPLKQGSQTESN